MGVAFSWRVVGLVAVATGLLVVAPTASAAPGSATMFVHSAKSGELAGGRLTLHDVGRRLTWITNSGRSGVVSVARLHRRLFLPGTPPATGTLHVAGHSGGDEPTFRLTRPRYDASRQTVSYGAKRLNKRRPPGRAARASQSGAVRRFGAASLSIVGAPQVTGGDNGGHDCSIALTNNAQYLFQESGDSNWPTDTWDPGIPQGAYMDADDSLAWESDGGLFRGCQNSATWKIVPGPLTRLRPRRRSP